MTRTICTLCLMTCLFSLFSCSKLFKEKIVSTVVKNVGDVELEMNYVSPSKMAKTDDGADIDSLILSYGQQLTFNLKLRSTDVTKQIAFRNIITEEDYNQRLYKLNFETKPLFWISDNEVDEHEALLTHFIRTANLNNEIEILIVFPFMLNEKSNKEFTVSFSDEVFQTGIHHFKYNTKYIINQQENNPS